jgi:hypothetical protein
MVPVIGRVPLQPPEAVHEAAFEALHCRVTVAPMATLASLAFNVSDGGKATAETPEVSNVEPTEVPRSHAASAVRAANPKMNFNANAVLAEWLRRIELIMRLPDQ